jgi:hypothetical protein
MRRTERRSLCVMASRPDAKPNGTAQRARRRQRRSSAVGALGLENLWKPITRDPWSRWTPGDEPVRELEIIGVVADDSDTLMIRQPRQRTFDLELAPAAPPRARRSAHDLDSWHLARRLRELGSMRRVADEFDADIAAVRTVMQAAGIDPDQVRRDEVLARYRATGSIDAIDFPMFRAEIERFLREAGIDPHDTPVPHDVTDPEALEAIAAYRAAGTLEAATAQLGISGESVRRRIARAGLGVEDIETDADRRQREETVAAFHEAGRSLAGAARLLGIDPRTVRDPLAHAGVAPSTRPAAEKTAGVKELRDLYALVGSIRQVAALAGVSIEKVRRAVGPCDRGHRRGRRVSDDALDQAEMAYREHGSVRAAARALGMSAGTFQYRLRQAQARHGP